MTLRAVAIANFNGDGKPDVAAGDIAREGVVILSGQGDGRLNPVGTRFYRVVEIP